MSLPMSLWKGYGHGVSAGRSSLVALSITYQTLLGVDSMALVLGNGPMLGVGDVD